MEYKQKIWDILTIQNPVHARVAYYLICGGTEANASYEVKNMVFHAHGEWMRNYSPDEISYMIAKRVLPQLLEASITSDSDRKRLSKIGKPPPTTLSLLLYKHHLVREVRNELRRRRDKIAMKKRRKKKTVVVDESAVVVDLEREERMKKEEAEDHRLCVICMDGEKEYVGVPCGHLMFCEECRDVFRHSGKPCPVCNARMKSIIKVYTT